MAAAARRATRPSRTRPAGRCAGRAEVGVARGELRPCRRPSRAAAARGRRRRGRSDSSPVVLPNVAGARRRAGCPARSARSPRPRGRARRRRPRGEAAHGRDDVGVVAAAGRRPARRRARACIRCPRPRRPAPGRLASCAAMLTARGGLHQHGSRRDLAHRGGVPGGAPRRRQRGGVGEVDVRWDVGEPGGNDTYSAARRRSADHRQRRGSARGPRRGSGARPQPSAGSMTTRSPGVPAHLVADRLDVTGHVHAGVCGGEAGQGAGPRRWRTSSGSARRPVPGRVNVMGTGTGSAMCRSDTTSGPPNPVWTSAFTTSGRSHPRLPSRITNHRLVM